MKFWLEAELEEQDGLKICRECHKGIASGNLIYVEFELTQAFAPSTCDLHPEPTEKVMCHTCGKKILI